MDWIAATNNQHKLVELKRILEPMGIRLLSLREAGVSATPEENADTFAGNAAIKAEAVSALTGLPVLADDSGLSVDALNGAPGVYSARYGGEGLTDIQRYEKLLDAMTDVPAEARDAQFVCAIVLIMPSGHRYTFEGICRGVIGFSPKGENGFGYDPIFYVGDESFSTLSAEEKDRISHRGQALRALRQELEQILKEENA